MNRILGFACRIAFGAANISLLACVDRIHLFVELLDHLIFRDHDNQVDRMKCLFGSQVYSCFFRFIFFTLVTVGNGEIIALTFLTV